MSRQDQQELAQLRAERKALIGAYGTRGEKHPMGRDIGGLNPAAQRLHRVRGLIEDIERKYRAPAPTLTPLGSGYKWDQRGGLLYDIEYGGRRGKIGRTQGSPPHDFYLVENGQWVSGGYKTVGQAAKAFVAHAKGSRT